MFSIKKLLGDKAQLNGIQMLLKGLGFDIESLLPQAETALIDWFKGMEDKAGAKLTALAALEEDKFLISMYKVQEDGSLQQYGETFVLRNFKNYLKNLENLKNDESDIQNRPLAQIGTGTQPTGTPTEPTGTTEPTAEPTTE